MTKWNHQSRVHLFTLLKNKFGCKSAWGGSAYPQGKGTAYQEFLKELAAQMADHTGNPNLTAGAVKNQINWALQQNSIKYQNHFRNMVLNTAAALESGFLTYKDLPGEASMNASAEDDE